MTERQNKVVITDRMWARLLSSTNQPSFLDPKVVAKKVAETKEEDTEAEAQLLDGENHIEATAASDTKDCSG